ncbi:MAG: hypothetical protein V3U65_01660 [Granulosicoccaceae bacterium]
MLGTIISSLLGAGGGFLGAEALQSISGMGGDEGLTGMLAGPVAGLLGGGAIGSMFGGDARAAGEAAASGKLNIGQLLGGLAGGAGAGGIAQAVMGMLG